MNLTELVVNARVYEDAKEFLGVADVTLPKLSAMKQLIKGAGIAGEYNTGIPGYYSAMSMSIKFRGMTDGAIVLAEPRSHQIEVRVAEQAMDTTTRKKGYQMIKHVFITTPGDLDAGAVAAAGENAVPTEHDVSYWAIYKNGKKVLEVDPLNNICDINGTDFLKEVRAFFS